MKRTILTLASMLVASALVGLLLGVLVGTRDTQPTGAKTTNAAALQAERATLRLATAYAKSIGADVSKITVTNESYGEGNYANLFPLSCPVGEVRFGETVKIPLPASYVKMDHSKDLRKTRVAAYKLWLKTLDSKSAPADLKVSKYTILSPAKHLSLLGYPFFFRYDKPYFQITTTMYQGSSAGKTTDELKPFCVPANEVEKGEYSE